MNLRFLLKKNGNVERINVPNQEIWLIYFYKI